MTAVEHTAGCGGQLHGMAGVITSPRCVSVLSLLDILTTACIISGVLEAPSILTVQSVSGRSSLTRDTTLTSTSGEGKNQILKSSLKVTCDLSFKDSMLR